MIPEHVNAVRSESFGMKEGVAAFHLAVQTIGGDWDTPDNNKCIANGCGEKEGREVQRNCITATGAREFRSLRLLTKCERDVRKVG